MSPPQYTPFQLIRAQLISDGWRSPNSYSKIYAPITSRAAVYLFLMVDETELDRGFVAYVGMSTNLKQRMSSHPVLSEIDNRGHWVMTWFQPCPQKRLRKTEAKYIRKFNPPWNVIGKPRGVCLQ